MKKNFVLGFLGIAVILFNYIGFPHVIKSAILITLGSVVSFISFRGIIKDKFVSKMKEEKMED